MMIEDLLSSVAGLVADILSRLEGRGPRIEFQGPSLYEFMDDLLAAFPGSGVQRIDDHTVALRDAVMLYELIEELPEHVTGTSLEELEERGAHLVRSGPSDPDAISFSGGREDGAMFEARILPSREWVFLIAASSEEGATALARMLDTRLETLGRIEPST